MSGPAERECRWVGSSLKDLKAMPGVVIDEIGFALHQIQMGTTPGNVKALKGYGGAGVLEVLESHNGNAYRAVYTVKFEGVIYVLHAFQKKSRAGKKTPRPGRKWTRSPSGSGRQRQTMPSGQDRPSAGPAETRKGSG